MGYVSWHNYGYGVCVSDIEPVQVDRLEKMLACASLFHAEVRQWLSNSGISEPTYEDYTDFDQDYMLGLATLLARVIEEAEEIEFTACDDADGSDYLIYMPSYPWCLPEKERELTEEKICRILARYIGMLTEQEVIIDYQSVENGG